MGNNAQGILSLRPEQIHETGTAKRQALSQAGTLVSAPEWREALKYVVNLMFVTSRIGSANAAIESSPQKPREMAKKLMTKYVPK